MQKRSILIPKTVFYTMLAGTFAISSDALAMFTRRLAQAGEERQSDDRAAERAQLLMEVNAENCAKIRKHASQEDSEEASKNQHLGSGVIPDGNAREGFKKSELVWAKPNSVIKWFKYYFSYGSYAQMPVDKAREAYDRKYASKMPKAAFVKDAELLDDHVSLKYWLEDGSLQKLQQETLDKLNGSDPKKPYGEAWPEIKKLSDKMKNSLKDVNTEIDTVAEGKLHLEADPKKRLAYARQESYQLYRNTTEQRLKFINSNLLKLVDSNDSNKSSIAYALDANNGSLDTAVRSVNHENHTLARELVEAIADYQKTEAKYEKEKTEAEGSRPMATIKNRVRRNPRELIQYSLKQLQTKKIISYAGEITLKAPKDE